jgi:hypothetical protein
MKTGSDLRRSIRKLIAQSAIHDGDTVIDSGTGRPRFFIRLKTHIVQERRFRKILFHNVTSVMDALPPADKVQQIVGIGTQCSLAQTANVLAV